MLSAAAAMMAFTRHSDDSGSEDSVILGSVLLGNKMWMSPLMAGRVDAPFVQVAHENRNVC